MKEGAGKPLLQRTETTSRNHFRLRQEIRLRNKPKSNNCTESCIVKIVGTWRERAYEYPGRSHGHGRGDKHFMVFLQPENIGPDILGVPLEIAQRRKGLIFKGIHVQ